MKFKLFFIFVLFLVSINIVSSVDISSSYTLITNFTFEGTNPASEFDSITGSTWSYGTTTPSPMGGTKYLEYDNDGASAFIFNKTGNQKLNLSNYNSSYIIRGWVSTLIADNSWNGFVLAGTDDNNFDVSTPVAFLDGYRKGNITRRSGTYSYKDAGFIADADLDQSVFYFIVFNISARNVSWNVYYDSSQTTSPISATDIHSMTLNTYNNGWFGFFCHRDCAFDSIEVWEYGVAPPPVNSPPSVFNLTQYPANATLISILQGVNISADITDTDLNLSSIYLDLKLNKSYTTINGTLINQNTTNKYNTSIGNSYYWLKYSETELFSGTYNINPYVMESTNHLNLTLSTSSNYIKMEFLNITPNVNFSFYEIMSENATSTVSLSRYYYCNSSYISGNPVISSNCALFASETNNKSFSHIHTSGKSKHKVYSLNVVNSQIEGVGVTEKSYILKQGSSSGDLVYYIPIQSRQNATQYTSNNGATWISRNYTIDSHIHQIRPNEVFYYRVCASDNASQQTCSAYNVDYIDVPNTPPSQLVFYSPINKTYNTSLLINHSISTSATNLNITSYDYYYSTNNFDGIFINTQTNNTPFTWDISLIADGDYYIDVIIKDSLNQSTISSSQRFKINNTIPPTAEVQALNNIANNIYTLSEVLNMIGYIFLFIVNLIILFLLINNRLDNLYSFFNGIFSLVLVVLFWNDLQIIAYLELIVLVFNMMLFFKPADSVGKTW